MTAGFLWLNTFNQFEKNFIKDAVAKIASREWTPLDIISEEKSKVMAWLDNSEKFQSYQYQTFGFGLLEDLKIALGSFLMRILKNEHFNELVKAYLED
jgi:hypothetical protein